MSLRPALFLDRDGVINVDKSHVFLPSEIEFVDGIFELVRAANDRGIPVIVVTNQGGIARGKYTEEQFLHLMEWMREQFMTRHARLDAVYYCPHHADYGDCIVCNCRKPEPGMLTRAASEHGLDLTRSIMVGDKRTDMQAAAAAGVPVRVFHAGWEYLRPAEATCEVKDLREILPLLGGSTLAA